MTDCLPSYQRHGNRDDRLPMDYAERCGPTRVSRLTTGTRPTANAPDARDRRVLTACLTLRQLASPPPAHRTSSNLETRVATIVSTNSWAVVGLDS